MALIDTWSQRVTEAIMSAVLSLLVPVLSEVMQLSLQAADPPQTAATDVLQLTISVYQGLPLMLAVAGLFGATIVAGPIGFIGVLMELIGSATLLTDGSGFGLIFFGAGLVAVGRLVWRTRYWVDILEAFTSSSRGGMRR